MINIEIEEAREEYLKDIENVVVCVTFEHLQKLFEQGKERIRKEHAPARSQMRKMKQCTFDIPAKDFLKFVEISLRGESIL